MKSRSKLTYLTYLFVFAWTNGFCLGNDNPEYSSLLIPENLKLNAHTVIREDHTVMEIKDEKSFTLSYTVVRTILNEKGDNNNTVVLFYDNEVKVNQLEGNLYDKYGNHVKKLKKSDIRDVSAVYGSTMYSDSRVQYAKLFYSDYPYTVEYKYELEYDKTFHLPTWMPLEGHSQSTQHSSLHVISPKSYRLRYYESNVPEEVKTWEKDGYVNYKWEASNLEGFEPESYMPNFDQFLPFVKTAPSDFYIDGYSGTLSSWNNLAEFIQKLNSGRDLLSEEMRSKLINLTKDAKTDREKIRVIYEYLQENTRYVSVQLGIGGYQPFEANYVIENGYGDCKALSNFTYAMLKAIGIKSHYALIQAGRDRSDIITEFPMSQFNHAILCVPNKGDTIWLECTSQTNPFGYLGTFTRERHALLITDEGGVLVKTPEYPKEKNQQIRQASVALFEDGSAEAEVFTKYSGLQYENISRILDVGEEEQKKFIYENTDIASFNVADFNYSQYKEAIPRAEEKLSLKMRRFATASGNRIFFQPNLMNKRSSLDKPVKERKFEVDLSFPFEDIDTVVFNVPLDYHLEFIPEPTKLESEFGSYYSEIFQREGQIIYIRHRSRNKGLFPKEKYKDFVDFENKISQSDKLRIVLVKET